MDPRDPVKQARDALSVRQVYGQPLERDGATVIPAAMVVGGGGGGGSDASAEQPPGGGAGFGLFARPVGAFEVRGGSVRWEPATDRTWIVIALVPVALALLRYLLARGGD